MNFHLPNIALISFIDYYWTASSSISTVIQQHEIMTPRPSVELIFNSTSTPGIFLIRGANFISRKPFSYIGNRGDNDPIFGVSFKVNGLRPFSSCSLKDFTIKPLQLYGNNGENILPEDILGKLLMELSEQIFEADNIQKKISLVNSFFIRKLAAANCIDHFTDYVIKQLICTKGLMTIDDLSIKFKVNKRTIERRILNVTGFTPKTLNRIIRFNLILKSCKHSGHKELRKIIEEFGYYDPSHFQKDFKSFTTLSPSSFFTKNYHVFQD